MQYSHFYLRGTMPALPSLVNSEHGSKIEYVKYRTETSEEFLPLLDFSAKQLTCLAEKVCYQV